MSNIRIHDTCPPRTPALVWYVAYIYHSFARRHRHGSSLHKPDAALGGKRSRAYNRKTKSAGTFRFCLQALAGTIFRSSEIVCRLFCRLLRALFSGAPQLSAGSLRTLCGHNPKKLQGKFQAVAGQKRATWDLPLPSSHAHVGS